MTRRATQFALAIGAAGSLALTLYFGRHNPHMTITVMFAGWVSAPYALLGVADWYFRERPAVTRTVSWLAALVTLASIGVYADGAFRPRAVTPAAPFVAVPLVSLVVIALVVGLAARRIPKG
jgi:hypothetical protein